MTQKHVVLIEDQEDLRWVLKTALRNEGFLVSDFADGESALSTTIDPPPEICIIDSGLPGMSGVEVGAQIHAQHSDNSPILVLFTGTDSAKLREKSTAAGFSVFIVKPVDINSLTQQLQALVARPTDLTEG